MHIENDAFNECISLVEVKISQNKIIIGENAFPSQTKIIKV